MAYNILLAEDDHFYLTILQRYFLYSKFHLFAVSTGERAVSMLLGNNQFDIAILDFHLPDKTAIEIINEIHEAGLFIPVVVMTGDEAIETEKLVRSQGVDYFIVKPISLSDLEIVLAGLLERRVVALNNGLL